MERKQLHLSHGPVSKALELRDHTSAEPSCISHSGYCRCGEPSGETNRMQTVEEVHIIR